MKYITDLGTRQKQYLFDRVDEILKLDHSIKWITEILVVNCYPDHSIPLSMMILIGR